MTVLWLWGGLGLLVALSVAEDARPRLRPLRLAWTVAYLVGAAILVTGGNR